MVKIGPTGGSGGQPIEDYLLPEGAKLREVHIFSEDYIVAIQFVYRGPDGSSVVMPRLGGREGQRHIFFLDEDEYLLGIQGRCGWFIDNLNLHTNKRSSPQYGGRGGEKDYFLNAPPGNEIVGLFGRAGWFIDALGIITRERGSRAQKAAALPVGDGKDLQKVEGIGPKIAGLLVAAGIGDLAALARADVAQLTEILAAAGKRYRLADPTTWPDQAALGASGDWDGLAAMQAKLKGGRLD